MLIRFYFSCNFIGAHAELQSAKNRPVVVGKTTLLRQKRQ